MTKNTQHIVLITLVVVAVPLAGSGWRGERRESGEVWTREAASRAANTFPAADEDTSGMDAGPLSPARSQGAKRGALEGRPTTASGTDRRRRSARSTSSRTLSRTHAIAPNTARTEVPAPTAEVHRARQRAVLREGDGAKPRTLRAVARQARRLAGVPARPVRE